jgi:hypothetical protein
VPGDGGPTNVKDEIAGGVQTVLFDRVGVLHEAHFKSSFIDDGKDYVCGRGVLMRHLPGLRNFDFKQKIVATANAAWQSRDKNTTQFGAKWNPDKDAEFAGQYKTVMGLGDGPLECGNSTRHTAMPYRASSRPPVSMRSARRSV